MKRRTFIRSSAVTAAGIGILGASCTPEPSDAPPAQEPTGEGPALSSRDALFTISLAQWSLHRTIRAGDLDPLDFAVAARNQFGIDAIEYVNGLFADKRSDEEYLKLLKERAEGEGVQSLLIMCDGEGRIGDPDEAARLQTVENHRRWLDAAAYLGCHSIRVNADAGGEGSREEQAARAADGLRRLCELGDEAGLNVIVENHGGLSSDGAWLAEVMRLTDHPRVGTLPDFGNFAVSEDVFYDPYLGMQELMPFAKAVSAKSRLFTDEGVGVHWASDMTVDYERIMRIVLDAGYRGYVGVEYEGEALSEADGILATKELLEDIRTTLTPEYS